MGPKFEYPNPRRDDALVEDLHGHKITDCYRWMEDPDSDETKAFVTAQNEVSHPFISSCPERERINSKLTKLWNYPKFGVPHKEGNKYFFSKNSGLQNQSVVYIQDSLDGEASVFFDPNLLSEDGTISMIQAVFSEDGSILAYGLSKSGSDWFDIHFKSVETGEDYPEVLQKAKFCNLSWTHDNKGIFYGCYSDFEASGRNTEEQSNQKLYYHRIGTAQAEDILCVEFPENPKWRIFSEISECGRYLLVCTQQDCRDNLVFFADLKSLPDGIAGKIPLTQVIFKLEYDYEYITNFDNSFVYRTNKDAPNYQLVVFDFGQQPTNENWEMKTLLPQEEAKVLQWACCVSQNKLLICYMQDVKNVLQIHDLETGKFLYNVPLAIGSVDGVHGRKKSNELFFKFSSMVNPGVIYFVDMAKEAPVPEVFRETVIEGLDTSMFELVQVFYDSKDGTKIPMFIASSKDLAERNSTTPTLLYGYGGFNVSFMPSFGITRLFFAKHFGYFALANLRGGGEYGESWHNGGRLFNKQNVFDDFHSAAEFLIREKYTCKDKLAIQGGSNGGLLVGACCNQRPELYGAGIAQVGVMDMLRFHKFTIGYAWCSDFGNPDEKAHFENVLKYSPLHNIREPQQNGDQYPAMLLTTADHDDRVVPSHTLKFIAELQHKLGKHEHQANPLMVRIDTKAGHGMGKPTSKLIEEITEIYCFLVLTLGFKFVD